MSEPTEAGTSGDLRCPVCSSRELSASVAVYIEMVYDPETKGWSADVDDIDTVEMAREAHENFDTDVDVLCANNDCAYEGPLFTFKVGALPEIVTPYIVGRTVRIGQATE